MKATRVFKEIGLTALLLATLNPEAFVGQPEVQVDGEPTAIAQAK